GSSLDGAKSVLVTGRGVSARLLPGSSKVDEQNRPLWQAKCQGCHELRSPSNRSLTAGQWAATVDRMVRVRQAPISAEEAGRITQYLQSASRAGRGTAQVRIESKSQAGIYEP